VLTAAERGNKALLRAFLWVEIIQYSESDFEFFYILLIFNVIYYFMYFCYIKWYKKSHSLTSGFFLK